MRPTAVMALVLPALAAYFTFIDGRSLRAIDPAGYARWVRRSPLFWGLMGVLFAFVTLPIYFYRRRRFFKNLAAPPEGSILPDPALFPLTQSIGIVLGWHLISQLSSFLAPSVWTGKKGDIPFDAVLIQSVLSCVFIVAAVRYFRRNAAGRYDDMAFLRPPERHPEIHYFVAVMAGAWAAILSSAFQVLREKEQITPLKTALESAGPQALGYFAVAGLIVGPLIEEVVFRGFIFDVFDRLKGRRTAVAAVTLIFISLHADQYYGDILAIGAVSLSGLAFTLMRSWSGSIYPGVVAHYLFNIASVVLPIILTAVLYPSYMEYMSTRADLKPAARIDVLDKAIKERPRFHSLKNDLAWELAGLDRELPRALALAEEALAARPGHPAFLDTKAEVLYKLKRIDEAVEIEEKLAKTADDGRTDYYLRQLQKFQSTATK